MEQVDSIINGPHAYLMEDLTVLPAFPRLAHFLMTYFQTYAQCETILRTLRSKKKKRKYIITEESHTLMHNTVNLRNDVMPQMLFSRNSIATE